MTRRLGIAILMLIVLGWSEASAQSRRDIELGLDGGVGMVIVDDETFITVGFPVQNLRVGWFASDRVEIEPSVAFQRISSHIDSLSLYGEVDVVREAGGAELALSYHGGGAGAAGRVFLKAGGLVLFAKDTDSQFGVEAGFGWKQRVGSHWALRIELTAGRTFEGAWLPGLTFGFSHFSKSE